ncbi:MAG: hypothetical protein HUK22_00415, partial [Thermoguttaceae bacterium]|nr:hypothetical protein [Thermoguttaceae bacterium]
IAFFALAAFVIPKSAAVRPAAFLPRGDALRAGEAAASATRYGDETSRTAHKILGADQRQFSANFGARAQSFYYTRTSALPPTVGAGLFVERDGRAYLAGLCAGRDSERDEALFLPLEYVAQALQIRDNLAAVYNDQIAGKFASEPGGVRLANHEAPAKTSARFDEKLDELRQKYEEGAEIILIVNKGNGEEAEIVQLQKKD